MNPREPSLQVGDLVMLRHGAAVPPNSHVVPGTVGRVLLIDDPETGDVTVRFVNSGRPVRLRRHDLMGFSGDLPMQAPAQETLLADQALQVGDLVEILSTAEPAPGRAAPPKQFGRILELEDAEGRVTVEIQRRHYPVRLLPEDIRRVDLSEGSRG
jgi:hypothetical protein